MSQSKYRPAAICLFLVVSLVTAETAWGQMFGSRSVGRPLGNSSSRLGTSSAQGSAIGAANVLEGSERFLRENRSRNDFVGSDRRDTAGFVGSQQALGTGRVRAATEGLQIDITDASRINRPLPAQPAKGIYYPRLEINFELPGKLQSGEQGEPAQQSSLSRVAQRLQRIANSDIALDVQNGTAILRGRVDSVRTRELLQAIASFEPGIETVRNELTVSNQ